MKDIYDDILEEPDDEALYDLETGDDRFRAVLDIERGTGELSAAVDPATLTPRELEEFEARVIELARIDPSTFIQYVLEWPVQPCHIEWQEFLSAHDRAILWAPIEHGKTGQVSVARPLWELGRDPNLRIALLSNTESQSAKSLAVIKTQIELNPRLRRVFPLLRREQRQGRRQQWHDTAIVVQRDALDNRDTSIQAIGASSAIVGARIDLAILDDVLDMENTLHDPARQRTLQWFDSSIASRITARGSIWCIGTAWHREDLMHVLAKRPAWKSRRYDATARELWPELSSIGGKLCGWPKWRLDKKRQEIPALEFSRQFRNIALSDDAEIFNTLSIEGCFDGTPWDPPVQPEWQTFVGVDLNVKKGESFDKTSFFMGRLETGVKIVQRIVAGNMKLAEILYWFLWIEARYHPVIFLVENNAAQDYIVQWFKPDTITQTFAARGEDPSEYLAKLPRVKGFNTGANKMDPRLGIWGMTIDFEQHRWRIPDHPLTRVWKDEMLDFDPDAHTGDILMSSWLFHSATLKFRPRRLRSSSISSG